MGTGPKPLVAAHAHRIPAGSEVLELACGEGQAAVFYAGLGHRVTAVDVSPVGLAKARALAKGADIAFVQADLDHWEPTGRFDALSCIHYWNPDVLTRCLRALRPGGVAIVEVLFGTRGRFRARPGELRALFRNFDVHHDVEREGGDHAVAQIVATLLTST